MKIFLTILFLILLWSSSFAQVQIKSINDFSGGLVTGLSNSLMKDNMALVLDNWDIVADANNPLGALKRRKGKTFFAPDSTNGTRSIVALFPWYGGLDKKLFVLREKFKYDGNDTDSSYVITVCENGLNATGPICTTRVMDMVAPGDRRNSIYNYNTKSAHTTQNFALATMQSELLLYHADSNVILFNRPLGPGQPRAVPYNGSPASTSVTGKNIIYKYVYDSSGTHSNLSIGSFPITVKDDHVIISAMSGTADNTERSEMVLYRSVNGSPFYAIDSFANPGLQGVTYFDTNDVSTIAAAGDSTTYRWGDNERNIAALVTPPGGLELDYDTLTGTLFQLWFPRAQDTTTSPNDKDSVYLGYSFQFVDLNGKKSLPSPVTWVFATYIDSTNHTFFAAADNRASTTITSIPVGNPKHLRKDILRVQSYPFSEETKVLYSHNAQMLNRVYKIAELSPELTTFRDTISSNTIRLAMLGFSTTKADAKRKDVVEMIYQYGPDSTVESAWEFFSDAQEEFSAMEWTSINDTVLERFWTFGEFTDSAFWVLDSLIPFQPSDIAWHGSRLYAVGDWNNLSRIYYTDFGEPQVWPSDKFIELGSAKGDWFNSLLSISNDRLIMGRQNSVQVLSGLSFFQYRVDNLFSGVGTSAPRSLLSLRGQSMFTHRTGVWATGGAEPISSVLAGTIDSAGSALTYSVSREVNGELWVTMDVTNSGANHKTYIYSPSPVPHWRSYDFPFDDIVEFEYDGEGSASVMDYSSGQYVMASNDTLWRWSYRPPLSGEDSLDLLGLFESIEISTADTIEAIYQSKYFFDNDVREKILWVDIDGAGMADSLTLMFYKNTGSGGPGTLFKTIFKPVDFTDTKRDRFIVNEICENFSVKIVNNTRNAAVIQGYDIGFIPWDGGKLK